MAALGEVNDTFGLFAQYAGTGAALEQMWRFYARMPLRPVQEVGATYTRASVWRRYGIARATLQGEPRLANALATWSDDAILTLFQVDAPQRQ